MCVFRASLSPLFLIEVHSTCSLIFGVASFLYFLIIHVFLRSCAIFACLIVCVFYVFFLFVTGVLEVFSRKAGVDVREARERETSATVPREI